MDTRFDFKNEEGKIYEEWETSGYFKPVDDTDKPTFSIILPPPNANADLHLGHAMYVIEDIMARYHRMKGDSVLWLPGADHAGFETQFVYEKHLAKMGKSRFDFDRDTLFKDIWDFVQKNRGVMENQLRRLGFSLDWSRKKFTLDPEIQKIVYATFKKLYDDGLIYRGQRLVNYCTKCGTSFSDLEVKHEEVEGKLYFIKYPIINSNSIIVATTRPETMFGDVAIAVHPDDARYKNLIGKRVQIPLTEKEIPIIADAYAKQEFGTGAVKITPAHDVNDYEVGQRHHLEVIQIIGFNGKLNEKVPEQFRNLNVLAGREKVVEELQKNGFLEKIENHKMVLSKCYRCNRILEPLPLPQWFLSVKPLIKPALDAIEKNEIMFYPASRRQQVIDWLNNFHDWNISRQVVWGMRIPAWKCTKCNNWIITNGEKPAKCPKCGSADLQQDPDTFDTWFSSGQWPFATLMSGSKSKIKNQKSKKENGDFERFYPTSVMETAYDILHIWVCRMIFMGIYATGKIPFKNVYFHGLLRDSKGQKMSKSKGNVVNPLDMVDKYGADALRASLLFGIGQGADVPFSEERVRAMRNFVTKIWNMGRFLDGSIVQLLNCSKDDNNRTIEQSNNDFLPFYTKDLAGQKPEDKQIVEELEKLIASVTQNFEKYEFSKAFDMTYEFTWHRFADWYIETVKERLKNGDKTAVSVLHHVFLNCLKLLHPFMPFVTEALWEQMPRKRDEMLIVSQWPKIN